MLVQSLERKKDRVVCVRRGQEKKEKCCGIWRSRSAGRGLLRKREKPEWLSSNGTVAGHAGQGGAATATVGWSGSPLEWMRFRAVDKQQQWRCDTGKRITNQETKKGKNGILKCER